MENASPIPVPKVLLTPAIVPEKLMLGPGPSNVPASINEAMCAPILGHLHTEFIEIMDQVKLGVQYAFQTRNRYTFAVSGTGHAGMECAIMNLLEPGDRILVVCIGLWGDRASDMAERNGATVKRLIADHGQAITIEAFREAVSSFKPHVVFVCHGESSTGVCQPLTGLGAICAEHNALLLVDTVASLGGAPFAADALGVDCVYTATQKVLNAPPGVAPISFSDRAMAKIKSRSTPIHSFYFDALLLGNYWGCDDGPRRYHHTAPISTVYALRAALSRLAEEGVDECVQRHAQNAQLFYKELHDIGLELFVDNPEYRLPCLTTVKVPAGVDWKAVVDKLMSQRIEISGGLGPTVGKIWRIGTFGVNSSPETIGRVVKALKEALHP